LRIVGIVAAAMLILAGCAELFLQPYGVVSPDGENVRVGTVSLPGNAPTIAQGYNPRPEIDSEAKSGGGHKGIDIYAEKGTPVIAVAAGIILGSYSEPFYGDHIIIDHGRDGKGVTVSSRYLHLDERIVNKGDRITRGQKIGTLGSSGILASYPHLHFEIRVGPKFESRNPHLFWADGKGVVTCFDKSKEYQDKPFMTTYPVPCR
jgi:murein DD-endopeptidase MepM/ murein hydrolase activator NlpD